MSAMKIIAIILGVFVAGSGIFFLAAPGATFLTLSILIGIDMIAAGLMKVVSWMEAKKAGKADWLLLVEGALSCLLGIVIIGNYWAQLIVDMYIVCLAAVWLMMIAGFRIFFAFQVKKAVGKGWVPELILGILCLIAGIVSMINPFVMMFAIGTCIGIDALMAGIGMIVLALKI